jgi:hypothetical protein
MKVAHLDVHLAVMRVALTVTMMVDVLEYPLVDR